MQKDTFTFEAMSPADVLKKNFDFCAEQRKQPQLILKTQMQKLQEELTLPGCQSSQRKSPNWQLGIGTPTTEDQVEIRSRGANRLQELQ